MEALKFPLKYIALAIGVLLLLGLLLNSRDSLPLLQIQSATAGSTDNVAQPVKVATYYYEVAGQIKAPGVFAADAPLLVSEAISRAGGYTPTADLAYVSKNIRLAVNVKAGEKIYIPDVKEAQQSNTQSGDSSKLNFNTATAAELDQIPGVGPATAQKIIAIRPVTDCNELTKISGLSAAVKATLLGLCQ